MSVLVLIIVNLIPLYGVFFLGWQANNMITLYYLEGILVGLFTIAKMVRVVFYRTNELEDYDSAIKRTVYLENVRFVGFFFLWYNSFLAFLGLFVNKMLGGHLFDFFNNFEPYKWNLIAIIAGFLISYKLDFLELGKYKTFPDNFTWPSIQRVLVLFSIIFLFDKSNDSITLLVVLIVSKTLIEVMSTIGGSKRFLELSEDAFYTLMLGPKRKSDEKKS
jgi:hypothetical protein